MNPSTPRFQPKAGQFLIEVGANRLGGGVLAKKGRQWGLHSLFESRIDYDPGHPAQWPEALAEALAVHRARLQSRPVAAIVLGDVPQRAASCEVPLLSAKKLQDHSEGLHTLLFEKPDDDCLYSLTAERRSSSGIDRHSLANEDGARGFLLRGFALERKIRNGLLRACQINAISPLSILSVGELKPASGNGPSGHSLAGTSSMEGEAALTVLAGVRITVFRIESRSGFRVQILPWGWQQPARELAKSRELPGKRALGELLANDFPGETEAGLVKAHCQRIAQVAKRLWGDTSASTAPRYIALGGDRLAPLREAMADMFQLEPEAMTSVPQPVYLDGKVDGREMVRAPFWALGMHLEGASKGGGEQEVCPVGKVNLLPRTWHRRARRQVTARKRLLTGGLMTLAGAALLAWTLPNWHCARTEAEMEAASLAQAAWRQSAWDSSRQGRLQLRAEAHQAEAEARHEGQLPNLLAGLQRGLWEDGQLWLDALTLHGANAPVAASTAEISGTAILQGDSLAEAAESLRLKLLGMEEVATVEAPEVAILSPGLWQFRIQASLVDWTVSVSEGFPEGGHSTMGALPSQGRHPSAGAHSYMGGHLPMGGVP